MNRLPWRAFPLLQATRVRTTATTAHPAIVLTHKRLNHSHAHDDDQACWSCGKRNHCCKLFCGCGHLLPLEHHCNYFKLFGMPVNFALDEKQLERNFLQLQKKLHPDKYTRAETEEKKASMLNSSLINMAYQLLSSPTQRASYLLNMHGINVLEEGRTFHDPVLLTEIMELREEIEDANTTVEAENVASKLDPYIDRVADEVQHKFEAQDFHGMADAAVKLKYLEKVREEAKHKAHSFQIQDKRNLMMN